jgi:hypothetical protein
MSWPLLTVVLVACFVLAGCSSKTTAPSGTVATKQALDDGKGGIQGLLIDDVYRPVPGGTVLLLPDGLTATSDTSGQFSFVDLEPGTYTIKVDAPGHEAAPRTVDVAVGEYTELELSARRIVSDNGRIITTQYSVFIPCAADYIVNGYIIGCIEDESGDSYRPGFTTDSRAYGSNVTYLVSEARMNKKGDYDVQVREDDGSGSGGARYAVGAIRGTDYIKMVNQYGVADTVDDLQHNTQPWNNTAKYETLVFLSGQQRDTFSGVSQTTCNQDVDDLNRGVGSPVRTCNWRGVGVELAIKATFIQSLFLGPPIQDIGAYATMGPS